MSKELETKVAELEKANAKLEKANAKHVETIDQQKEVIDGLQAEISTLAAKKTIDDVVVEHEGKKYRVTIPRFNHNKEVYTADSLTNNPALVAELVKEGFGGFEEIAE